MADRTIVLIGKSGKRHSFSPAPNARRRRTASRKRIGRRSLPSAWCWSPSLPAAPLPGTGGAASSRPSGLGTLLTTPPSRTIAPPACRICEEWHEEWVSESVFSPMEERITVYWSEPEERGEEVC